MNYLHLGLSFIFVVMNIGLMFFYPGTFGMCENSIVTELVTCDVENNTLSSNSQYEESMKGNIRDFSPTDTGSLLGPIYLVLDVLQILFNLLFALPTIVLFSSQFIEIFAMRILIGVPIFFTYIYSFIGFIRGK